jgi:hypothetical protein
MDVGAVIVEWPERATLLPATRYDIELTETDDAATRRMIMRGHGDAAARNVGRIGELMAFLARQDQWRPARIAYLQGDASTRSYARLHAPGGTVLLMDAPRQPDGPPIRDGKPYSRIALLAEDMVRPFTAIGSVLRAAGLSAPRSWPPISTRGFCWSRTWAIACSAPRLLPETRRPSCGGPRSTR